MITKSLPDPPDRGKACRWACTRTLHPSHLLFGILPLQHHPVPDESQKILVPLLHTASLEMPDGMRLRRAFVVSPHLAVLEDLQVVLMRKAIQPPQADDLSLIHPRDEVIAETLPLQIGEEALEVGPARDPSERPILSRGVRNNAGLKDRPDGWPCIRKRAPKVILELPPHAVRKRHFRSGNSGLRIRERKFNGKILFHSCLIIIPWR